MVKRPEAEGVGTSKLQSGRCSGGGGGGGFFPDLEEEPAWFASALAPIGGFRIGRPCVCDAVAPALGTPGLRPKQYLTIARVALQRL